MRLVVHKALLLLLAAAVAEDEPASIINEISKKFGSTMLHCVQLLYPNTGYFKDVLDFWNHDLNVTGHIYLGCLAACSMFKLQLRNRDGSLNDTNVNNFLRDNGADEHRALILLEVFRTCQRESSSQRKACVAGLNTMICFRSNIYHLNWTPEFYRGPVENALNG